MRSLKNLAPELGRKEMSPCQKQTQIFIPPIFSSCWSRPFYISNFDYSISQKSCNIKVLRHCVTKIKGLENQIFRQNKSGNFVFQRIKFIYFRYFRSHKESSPTNKWTQKYESPLNRIKLISFSLWRSCLCDVVTAFSFKSLIQKTKPINVIVSKHYYWFLWNNKDIYYDMIITTDNFNIKLMENN